jgi:hypothetical protein
MARSPYIDWLARSLAIRATRPRAVPPPDTDLVLGYATGYGVREIAPFVRSLRAVYRGDVVLVVDADDELIDFLRVHDVEVVLHAPAPGTWAPHPVVARFSAYAAQLDQRPWVRNVILTDVRDVVFQADPFAAPVDGLEFFEENEGQPLARHAFNVKHLTAVAGEGLASAILDRACVCVGVVLGPRADVARFCRALLMLCAIPRSNVGGAFGADQAACNLIAHLDLLGGAVHRNYGRVATIGLTPPERLRLEGGRILNPDASISPIVHQYDRIGFLKAFVAERWGQEAPRPSAVAAQMKRRATTLRASLGRRLPEFR